MEKNSIAGWGNAVILYLFTLHMNEGSEKGTWDAALNDTGCQ